jgi:carbamoyl-phosphate synthase large subunit
LNINKINIGITGTGSLIGQAIIKCIKLSSLKDNVVITGFDYKPDTVGSYWCENNYVLPDIFKKNEDEQEWIRTLVKYIRLHKLQLLFIGIDFELPVFARLKELIEKETGCFIIVNNEEVIRIADDKFLTAMFLKEHDLFYPRSYIADNYQHGDVPFPLIIKPRIGARSVGVHLVKTQEEFDRVIPTVDKPVIQECIGTMDSEYTCGVIFLDGEVKASIALSRTLREGNTYTADFKKDAPVIIYDYLKKVSLSLKPYGVINFQLRLDQNNIPKIFEINARHSGTTYMRALFGYNEVEYIICYLLKLPLPSMENIKEGRAVRFYDEFFVENK